MLYELKVAANTANELRLGQERGVHRFHRTGTLGVFPVQRYRPATGPIVPPTTNSALERTWR
jgi:hypothetical protein